MGHLACVLAEALLFSIHKILSLFGRSTISRHFEEVSLELVSAGAREWYPEADPLTLSPHRCFWLWIIFLFSCCVWQSFMGIWWLHCTCFVRFGTQGTLAKNKTYKAITSEICLRRVETNKGNQQGGSWKTVRSQKFLREDGVSTGRTFCRASSEQLVPKTPTARNIRSGFISSWMCISSHWFTGGKSATHSNAETFSHFKVSASKKYAKITPWWFLAFPKMSKERGFCDLKLKLSGSSIALHVNQPTRMESFKNEKSKNTQLYQTYIFWTVSNSLKLTHLNFIWKAPE